MYRAPLLALAPLVLLAVTAAAAPSKPGASAVRVPDRVTPRVKDLLHLPDPAEVRLTGYLGDRVAKSEANRLVKVEEGPLLAGFRRRPGEQAWIGEHVGKWLHAATLAWVNTGDAALRAKLDRMVTELLKTQEADGYLGTYTPDKRFGLYPEADWDVWVHKYNLIGLLTYHRFTGDEKALQASRRIADLLIRTFGPDKKSILAAGTHVGMASTSVLEPMVLLYRRSGDPRYLEFCRYLVKAWDEPKGPAVLKSLLTRQAVHDTANGKAYEMLSNLVGLCELYRVTGERDYLQAAVNAWEDVTSHHLYITGTASHHEHFHTPHELPNHPGANVGETCVTVTWMQLNSQLLRLTGEARYGEELERSAYNHLAGAQRPDGAQWCYYTPLQGTKPYGPGINCCVSSGPRGMALLPQVAFLTYTGPKGPGIAVNFFEEGQVTTTLGGQKVTLVQQTAFPRDGKSALTVRTARPARFSLKVRYPGWTDDLLTILPGGKEVGGRTAGWQEIPARTWKNGDRLTIAFPLRPRVVEGSYSNAGRTAVQWGPLVLALDDARNPGLPPVGSLSLAEGTVRLLPGPGLAFEAPVQGIRETRPRAAQLVPFAEAGSTGGRFQVWRAPGAAVPNDSLFLFGDESRSRTGNVSGSIADGEADSFVVTFDGRPADEDWFAVRTTQPVTFRRVVYAHGRSFHDGGWFDASAGKPRVQVRRTADSAWVTIGVLEEYPATTAADSRGIRNGQPFTLRLAQPVTAVALRVIGRPASGDNPKQAFSSCAELQAFSE